MTPSADQSIAGLSIDTMLDSLSHQTPVAETPSENHTLPDQQTPVAIESEQTALPATFNIDSIAKPIVIADTPHPISNDLDTASRPSKMMWWFKTVGAFASTIVIVSAIGRFLSVQYPLQAQQFKNIVFGTAADAATVVRNNTDSTLTTTDIALTLTGKQIDDYHAAAQEYTDTIETPLADAITQAQGDTPSSTETILDAALGEVTGSVADSLSSTGSTIVEGTGSTETLSSLTTATQDLKTTISQLQSHYTAGNKALILRALSKNIDTLLTTITTSSESDYDTLSSELQKIKEVADKL